MEFMSEEEVIALLTRVAFVKHLPKQQSNGEFVKTLKNLSGREVVQRHSLAIGFQVSLLAPCKHLYK